MSSNPASSQSSSAMRAWLLIRTGLSRLYQQRAGRFFRTPGTNFMTVSFAIVRVALTGVLLVVLHGAPAAQNAARADQGVASREAQVPKANPQAIALSEFQSRLQKYLDLRSDLSRKLKPLSPTPDSAELAARQDTLAAAIREA